MIEFQHVVKSFGSENVALSDLNFYIESGELVFLTGPSGSGKTTILRLLTKEHTPTSGEISLGENSLSKIKKNKLHLHRRKIGVVFQDYRLLNEYNIWENVALPLYITGKKQKEIEERVTDLLDLVDLTHRAFHFPEQLSGGESQRISIARALATAPSLILADEPTGNLDSQNAKLILKLLTTINAHGTTVIVATHDMNLLATSKNHRRIHLEKGKLVSDSHPKQKKEVVVEIKTESESKARSNDHKEDSKNQDSNNNQDSTGGKTQPSTKSTSEANQKDQDELPKLVN